MYEYDAVSQNDLPPLPEAPWGTMLTTLALLFLFAALVFVVYYSSNRLDESVTARTGEQQLRELQDSERAILNNCGYDAETNTHRIPIDRAMDALIEEAKANKGEMKSFPAKKTKVP
jgi:hypothetical protein